MESDNNWKFRNVHDYKDYVFYHYEFIKMKLNIEFWKLDETVDNYYVENREREIRLYGDEVVISQIKDNLGENNV